MRSFWLFALALHVSACAGTPVEGPFTLAPERVVAVRVTTLAPGSPQSHLIRDADQIRSVAISYALNPRGWERSRVELVPRYRIDLIDEGGTRAVYWLGPMPSHFPCYSRCDGGWIAPSDDRGSLDPAIDKELSESAYLALLRDLGLDAAR